jgi:hypothetical protein
MAPIAQYLEGFSSPVNVINKEFTVLSCHPGLTRTRHPGAIRRNVNFPGRVSETELRWRRVRYRVQLVIDVCEVQLASAHLCINITRESRITHLVRNTEICEMDKRVPLTLGIPKVTALKVIGLAVCSFVR